MFLTIITIIFFLLIIAEISTLLAMGKWINKDFEIDLDEYTLNGEDNNIINNYTSWVSTPYITNVLFPILSKYYIHKIGTVPRWHPVHKQIVEKFKELKGL